MLTHLSYASSCIGFFLCFVMRAMGELLLSNLAYKSFADFATDLIAPWAGFYTGWTYWMCWVVIGIADTTAICGYLAVWIPNVPTWIPALAVISLLIGLNLVAVKLFGEMEFWFAMIKIVAIVSLILVGGFLALCAFQPPTPGAPHSLFHPPLGSRRLLPHRLHRLYGRLPNRHLLFPRY